MRHNDETASLPEEQDAEAKIASKRYGMKTTAGFL
jgi:hypothetical protein